MGIRALLVGATCLLCGATAFADPVTVVVDPTGFDRWLYFFNGTPGVRSAAPTFGAVGTPEFDNKDGLLIVAGDTASAGIPAGLPLAKYDVLSVEVTASHWLGSFDYDPTYDGWQTYLDSGDPSYVADSDPGRPIELYGIGLRNGFTDLSVGPTSPGTPEFEEGESHGGGNPGQRNAFPFDFGVPDAEGDVSNNVIHPTLAAGFETTPWAIGSTTSGLAPGDPVPQGSFGVSSGETFRFDVDISDPDIQEYVHRALRDGVLGFAIASMHETALGGGTNPNFYTSESADSFSVAPSLTVTIDLPDCTDGIDNDGDGFVDFPEDPGCKNAGSAQEDPQCQNGIDDDGDGRIDFDGGASLNGGVPLTTADVSCDGAASHTNERYRACGLGFEVSLVLPLIAGVQRRRRRRSRVRLESGSQP